MEEYLGKAQEELDNDPQNKSDDGMEEEDPLRNTDSEQEDEEDEEMKNDKEDRGDPDSDADMAEWEKMWGRKFENPSSFKEQLWNNSGPSLGAMEIYVKAVLDELEYEELSEEWKEESEKHPFITDKLREFLANEAGSTREDKQVFLHEVLEYLAEIDATKYEKQDQQQSDEDTSSRAQPSAHIGAQQSAAEAADNSSPGGAGQGDESAAAEPDVG